MSGREARLHVLVAILWTARPRSDATTVVGGDSEFVILDLADLEVSSTSKTLRAWGDSEGRLR